MAEVNVVGGGPAGLSAALYTQKNGLETTVFDTGFTWMDKAHLFNYLGIGSQDGSSFMETAREQVNSFGVDIKRSEEVRSIVKKENEFSIESDGDYYNADYVILATGANRDLANTLGCDFDGDIVTVDLTMETSIGNVYATGAMVRAEEWQAVISAGDGAAAALNILSKENGGHYHDFDVPEDAQTAFKAIQND